MKIYLVGGAVRDELLGLPVSEQDWVVVGATAEEMLAQGYLPVGKSFPVFLHPQTKEEYALARTERKVAGGYHGFTFNTQPSVTLEEDLQRRDLTINAMAKMPDGEIIDPYGGKKDLEKKILRHVSRAFVEDPVRVLRIARFAARFAPMGFTVAPETLELMREMGKQGELDHLVSERVWKEMERAFCEASPVAFIQTLRQCDALKSILPEVDDLYGVPQSPEHHPEIDTGIHTEMVLQQATLLSSDPMVRFAALMHDVGKALSPLTQLPKHPEHEKKGVVLVKQLCKRLRVPTDFQQLAQIVTQYHGEYHDVSKKDAKAILALLEQCDAFRRSDRFAQFLLACEADFRGRPGYETRPHTTNIKLTKALKAAQGIDAKALLQATPNIKGEEIKTAIAQARIEAITESLKE